MDYLTLKEAAARVPGRPHQATLWRWCKKGIGGVRLRYARAGRRIVTTEKDLDKFMRELAAREQDIGDEAESPRVDPASVERCERMGV